MKIERPLALKVYSVLCSEYIISRFLRFVNMLSKILFNHLPGGRKKPPLRKGSFFTFIYTLSFFLASTAFVSTNAKYGIPLSRYTVFLKTVL